MQAAGTTALGWNAAALNNRRGNKPARGNTPGRDGISCEMQSNEAFWKSAANTPRIGKPALMKTETHRCLRWMWVARLTFAVLCVVAIGGCNRKKTEASNINFQRAINAYFYNHRDECLFTTARKFPDEVKVAEKSDMKDMDALAKAGLLTRTEDGAFQLVRYELTPLGTRATGRFCFGHRDVTSVDSFTPLRIEDKRKASDVTYHYRIVDAPVWAQDEKLKKQFPELTRKTSGSAEGKTTVMSAYQGWEVPDYGKPVLE
jgi:hypothetical protein